ncbi:hypothetical protein HYH03_011468 [Edaphochlamys debaryana]|uniref:Uncharacterized protein n=1 Tax=Edaphochlamys debaryana TaxID=47281 RepID=A0A836BUW4_9CHLO|nr:hypothetical protein HYH03_011468 [Edaphochlamys debaryana]|eukprot:KAG2490001.1 hypothetical protein HYH03_011468 [Edaphochlamys debaryana]
MSGGALLWRRELASPDVWHGLEVDPLDCRRLAISSAQGGVTLIALTDVAADRIDVKQYRVAVGPPSSSGGAAGGTSSTSGSVFAAAFAASRDLLFLLLPREIIVYDTELGSPASNRQLPPGRPPFSHLVGVYGSGVTAGGGDDGGCDWVLAAHVDGGLSVFQRVPGELRYALSCAARLTPPPLRGAVPPVALLAVRAGRWRGGGEAEGPAAAEAEAAAGEQARPWDQAEATTQALRDVFSNDPATAPRPPERRPPEPRGTSPATATASAASAPTPAPAAASADHGTPGAGGAAAAAADGAGAGDRGGAVVGLGGSGVQLVIVALTGDGRVWRWDAAFPALRPLQPLGAVPKPPLPAAPPRLGGLLHTLPSAVTTFALYPRPVADGVGGSGAVLLGAAATLGGHIELFTLHRGLVSPLSLHVTSSFHAHRDVPVRGIRWLGASPRLASFSAEKGAHGWANTLLITDIRSGRSQALPREAHHAHPHGAARSGAAAGGTGGGGASGGGAGGGEAAPLLGIRASAAGAHLLVLVKGAPAELWGVWPGEEPHRLRLLDLPFTCVEWVQPALPHEAGPTGAQAQAQGQEEATVWETGSEPAPPPSLLSTADLQRSPGPPQRSSADGSSPPGPLQPPPHLPPAPPLPSQPPAAATPVDPFAASAAFPPAAAALGNSSRLTSPPPPSPPPSTVNNLTAGAAGAPPSPPPTSSQAQAQAGPQAQAQPPEELLVFTLADGRAGVLAVRGRRVTDTRVKRPSAGLLQPLDMAASALAAWGRLAVLGDSSGRLAVWEWGSGRTTVLQTGLGLVRKIQIGSPVGPTAPPTAAVPTASTTTVPYGVSSFVIPAGRSAASNAASAAAAAAAASASPHPAPLAAPSPPGSVFSAFAGFGAEMTAALTGGIGGGGGGPPGGGGPGLGPGPGPAPPAYHKARVAVLFASGQACVFDLDSSLKLRPTPATTTAIQRAGLRAVLDLAWLPMAWADPGARDPIRGPGGGASLSLLAAVTDEGALSILDVGGAASSSQPPTGGALQLQPSQSQALTASAGGPGGVTSPSGGAATAAAASQPLHGARRPFGGVSSRAIALKAALAPPPKRPVPTAGEAPNGAGGGGAEGAAAGRAAGPLCLAQAPALGSTLLLPRPWAMLLRLLLQLGVSQETLRYLGGPSSPGDAEDEDVRHELLAIMPRGARAVLLALLTPVTDGTADDDEVANGSAYGGGCDDVRQDLLRGRGSSGGAAEGARAAGAEGRGAATVGAGHLLHLLRSLASMRAQGRLLHPAEWLAYSRALGPGAGTAERMAVAAQVAGDSEEARFWAHLPATLEGVRGIRDALTVRRASPGADPRPTAASVPAPIAAPGAAPGGRGAGAATSLSSAFAAASPGGPGPAERSAQADGPALQLWDPRLALAEAQERIRWHEAASRLIFDTSPALQERRLLEYVAIGDLQTAVAFLLAAPPEKTARYYREALCTLALAAAAAASAPAASGRGSPTNPGGAATPRREGTTGGGGGGGNLLVQAAKVVSAHAASIGDHLLGVPLHVAAGLHAEAALILQEAGLWRYAAALAAHSLSGAERAAALQRWSDHVATVEGSTWRAAGLLTAGGCCGEALRLLMQAGLPDAAYAYAAAVRAAGLVVQMSGDGASAGGAASAAGGSGPAGSNPGPGGPAGPISRAAGGGGEGLTRGRNEASDPWVIPTMSPSSSGALGVPMSPADVSWRAGAAAAAGGAGGGGAGVGGMGQADSVAVGPWEELFDTLEHAGLGLGAVGGVGASGGGSGSGGGAGGGAGAGAVGGAGGSGRGRGDLLRCGVEFERFVSDLLLQLL